MYTQNYNYTTVQLKVQLELLTLRTTLYNLGDHNWARIFFDLAKQNKMERMFDVAPFCVNNVCSPHTFFFPVDAAFEVSAMTSSGPLLTTITMVAIMTEP